MKIKYYDLYDFNASKHSFIEFSYKDDIYSLTKLLKEIYPYESALWYENFIKKPLNLNKIGIFQEVEVTLDEMNNTLYISDASEDDYRFREINITASTIIKLCHKNELHYNTIDKDNFIHLISSWTKLLNQQTPFALLYQDDNDWFDVKPFETQEAMEQFVADHTQK